MIRYVQDTEVSRYLNLTTISTLLSGVTASALQIVTQGAPPTTILGISVNTFFLASLVFSIASAVQSVLAVTWIRSFV